MKVVKVVLLFRGDDFRTLEPEKIQEDLNTDNGYGLELLERVFVASEVSVEEMKEPPVELL